MFSLNDLIIDKHDYTEDVRKIIADDIEGELAAAEKEQGKTNAGRKASLWWIKEKTYLLGMCG